MSTFVDAVNRVLRLEGIIRGDDDTIDDFTSSQHAASIEFAKIAVQDEIAWIADLLKIPYERTTGTVTCVTSTRTYSFPSDFIRFTAEARLWEVDDDSTVSQTFLSIIDEDQMRRADAGYETLEGTPIWFYTIGATSNQLGMYPVPSSQENGTIYKFWYDKSVNVTTATDSMPFITTEQFNSFCNAAARSFKFIRLSPQERDGLFPNGIDKDPVLGAKRALLISQMKPAKQPGKYGRRYA